MVSLAKAQAIENIDDLLFRLQPGSGNNKTSCSPGAAQAGIGEFWTLESKRPAIIELLKRTPE